MTSFSRRRFATLAGAGLAAPIVCADEPPGFLHGVASGDPLADRVMLWSRVSGYRDPVTVTLVVAEDPNFERIVRRFETSTDASRDYTIKVDADGLAPGRRYYYRFATADASSPTGRTRTLPAADTAEVRLAVVSCSNYPSGFFNVYRALGHHNDLDAIVHLGDYIYEYPADGYASARSREFGRLSAPLQELVALADYRMRHAQYKRDPDLAYAHAQVPFIAIWDDHEITNDAWTDGAQNHQPNEGDFAARKRAALTAYREWMPIRDAGPPYRRFDFGRIATLAILETRVTARSAPLSYADDLEPQLQSFRPQASGAVPVAAEAFDAARGDFQLPRLIDPATGSPIGDAARVQSLLESGQRGIDYDVMPDIDGFVRDKLGASERRLMGDAQLDWLSEAVTDRNGGRWNIIGSQTLLGEVRAPNLDAALSRKERAAIPDYLQPLIPLTRFGLPMNLDAWDGFPAERARLLERLAQAKNTLVIAGDTHNAWAGTVPLSNGSSAYELGTPSVSSPGIAEALRLPPKRLESLFAAANARFDYLGFSYRGYLELRLSDTKADAIFVGVSNIDSRRYSLTEQHRRSLSAES
ncbi:MAG: alkaline phosphatase D family protein [Pseudomonadota bacterium]